MKRLLLLSVLALGACRSSTEYGRCVGLGDDRDPALVYRASVRNLFWGILGLQFIVPPIIVAVNEFYCPVGRSAP